VRVVARKQKYTNINLAVTDRFYLAKHLSRVTLRARARKSRIKIEILDRKLFRN